MRDSAEIVINTTPILSLIAATGSLGILLRAKQVGYPLTMAVAVQRMRQQGIWLSADLAKTALAMAGENAP